MPRPNPHINTKSPYPMQRKEDPKHGTDVPCTSFKVNRGHDEVLRDGRKWRCKRRTDRSKNNLAAAKPPRQREKKVRGS